MISCAAVVLDKRKYVPMLELSGRHGSGCLSR